MKNIYNPTESEVSITIKGIGKSIAAGETEEVSTEFAETWKATHQFLQLSDVVATTKKEVVKEEKKEEKVEVKKETLIKKAVKAVSKK